MSIQVVKLSDFLQIAKIAQIYHMLKFLSILQYITCVMKIYYRSYFVKFVYVNTKFSYCISCYHMIK